MAMTRRIVRAALIVGLALVWLAPSASSAAEPNFPAKDSLYHNYPEMVDEIMAAQAAYPDLVAVSSIGKSYKGRDIWIAKVSDNVTVDEPEPEVLIDALHHAREHLTTEQALYLLKVLTQGYAGDSQVKRLVDSREIWIVFALNPDGMQYDLTGNPYREWRKNRQPTPGSSKVGTDLNRNYDYAWGCCRGSSGSPGSLTYRGWKPFSAPETQAMRDFVRSRVVDGRQQIRMHLTLHTNGQLVLWPYGHTKTEHPVGHDRAWITTRSSPSASGWPSATATRPSSRATCTSPTATRSTGCTAAIGSSRSPGSSTRPSTTRSSDFYPPDERIAAAVARNRSALLYAIDMADCPYAPLSRQKTNCGPLYDDFEINRGWVRNPDGTDTATDGAWQIGNPAAVTSRGSEAARDDDVGPLRARDRRRRRDEDERPRPRRRDDHDAIGAGRPGQHGRRPDLPLLLRPPLELERGGLVPGLGRGRGRHPDARQGGARQGRRRRRPLGLGPDCDDSHGPARRSGS